jgi:hypothetical protein
MIRPSMTPPFVVRQPCIVGLHVVEVMMVAD